MIWQLLKKRRKHIVIDINTQRDFFIAGGNACIGNHRRVLANVRRVMAWARRNNVRVISTCEVYPNGNGAVEPGYCIDGTEGQKKISYSLLSNRVSFAADDNADFPQDLLRRYRQVVLYKRSTDPFAEPRIERLLSEIRAENFILIGASAEGAVKAAALGLLQRGKRVTVVADAVGSLNKRESKLAFRKMSAKGAKLVETKKLAGVSHLRHVGICECESCQGRTRKAAVKVGSKY